MSLLRISPMLQAASAVAALTMALLPQPVRAAAPDYADLLGTWRLTKVLDSSEISSLDDKEAARLVGKTFVIARDKVSLDGDACKEPEFEHHFEDTVRYLREEAHAASGKLGLPEVVEVVDLACTEVLRKNHDKLVLYWKGFFFDMIRQEPGPVQQTRR